MIYLISGGIVLLGAVICFSLIFYGKRKRAKAIEHYEKIRDQLTLREQKEKETEFEENKGLGLPFNIGNLIGGFVALLIGVTLLPAITKQVAFASETPEITGVTAQMLSLVPIFFALAILFTVIATIWSSLKSTGFV
jgi:hypothetical protein